MTVARFRRPGIPKETPLGGPADLAAVPFLGRLGAARLLVLGFPLVLLALDRRWAFNLRLRDPWIYHGYFERATAYLKAFPAEYFGTRLSVILPGYLVHRVLPDPLSDLVLHLGLATLSLLFLFELVRGAAGVRAAVLAGLLLGGNAYFLSAVGSDYVDGFGIFYALAALLASTNARTQDRPTASWVMLGAACAALIAANLAYAILVPFVLWPLLEVRWIESFRRRLAALATAVLGFLGVLAGLGLASLALGGPFLFLGPSVKFLMTFGRAANPFTHEPAAWLPHGGWLVFPAATFAGSVALVFGRLVRGKGRSALQLRDFARPEAALVAVGTVFVLLQVIGQPFLQHWYYASLILPWAAFALSGIFGPVLDGASRRRFGTLLLVTAVVLAGGYVWPPSGVASWLGLSVRPAAMAGLVVLAAASVAALLTRRKELFPGGILGLALAVAAAGLLLPMDVGYDVYGFDRWGVSRQIHGALGWFRRVDPDAKARFWYGRQDRAYTLYDLVAASCVSNYRFLSLDFPDTGSGFTRDGKPLRPGLRLLLLSQRPLAFSEAREALARKSLGVHLVGWTVVTGPAGPVSLFLLEVADPGPEW